MTHAISVGQLYLHGRTHWPECTQYNYRGGAHELLLFLGSPSPAEIKSVRQGGARFALHVEQPVVLLLWSFAPGLPWSDASYSWHLVPAHERDLPSADLEEDKGILLRIVLVDAATGLVRAIRAVSLTSAFARALHAAIREQAARVWSEAEYDATLQRVYAQGSAESLARASKVHSP